MRNVVSARLGLVCWVERWFASQCDGDWEHNCGIRIESTDNPGWAVEIDVAGTYLEGRNFLSLDIGRGEHDWVKCRIEDNIFKVTCGPSNVSEALMAFRHWAETST